MNRASNWQGASLDGTVLTLDGEEGTVTYDYNIGPKTVTFRLAYGSAEGIAIDEVNFPDEAFRSYVLASIDTDGNGQLSRLERSRCTVLNLSSRGIADTKGLEYFTETVELLLSNNPIGQVDVSALTKLQSLDLSSTQVTSVDVSALEDLLVLTICNNYHFTGVDVSKNPNLVSLYLASTGLESLDVTKNAKLQWLIVEDTPLTGLDLSGCPELISLHCIGCDLTAIDLSHNPKLQDVNLGENRLTSLDVSACPELINLQFYDNQISELTLGEQKNLVMLSFWRNQITEVDVTGMPELVHLDCGDNRLTQLDVTGNAKLEELYCYGNQLTSIDLSGNPSLHGFAYGGNERAVAMEADGTFDLSTLPGFDVTKAGNWSDQATVEGSILTFYYEDGIVCYDYKTGNDNFPTAQFGLIYGSGGVAVDEEHFPDESFRQYVLENMDWNGSGYLSPQELLENESIDVGGLGVSDLTGVELFPNLKYLFCWENDLTGLDVSQNPKLEILNVDSNRLTELDVSANTALRELYCGYNQLTELDLSVNTKLVNLSCAGNQLAELKLDGCTALKTLNCAGNRLTVLDLSRNIALEELVCGNNQLTSLDLNNNTALSKMNSTGGNRYSITVKDGKFDLTTLPGSFNVNRTTDWQGGTVEGSILTVEGESGEVTYSYRASGEARIQCTLVYTNEITPEPEEEYELIYRLYLSGSGKHHYTNSVQERDALTAGGWIYEGVAWKAPVTGEIPIYRLHNPGNDNHLYTKDAGERDTLVAGGWDYEGIAFYSAGEDGTPLYRVYNPHANDINPHHYTDSMTECEYLSDHGWKVEGVAWYGLK